MLDTDLQALECTDNSKGGGGGVGDYFTFPWIFNHNKPKNLYYNGDKLFDPIYLLLFKIIYSS
jgi:hypothetical protein